MIKRFIPVVTGIFLMININTVFAADSLNGWNNYKDINLAGSNKYKSVYLDDEVYKFADASLKDIRIVNNSNEFVPYYIENSFYYSQSTSTTYKSSVIRSIKKKNDTITDFEIKPVSPNTDIVANKIELVVNEPKFLKNIEVYGSFDNITWNYILKDSIYKIENLQKTSILLGEDKRYSFYRIKVIDNIENVNIQGFNLIRNYTESYYGQYDRKTNLDYERKEDGKNTVITLKNDNRLKLKQLKLSLNGTFKRRYEVFINTANGLISTGNTGDLYNLNFKELNISNAEIKLGEIINNDRIIIKIYNQDDKPLDIKGIEGMYSIDKLVFESKPDTSYKLYFGNINTAKPSYDIESYKNQIEKELQDQCALGKIVTINNTADSKVDSKYLFNIVVVILAVGLISLLIVKLKSKID